MPYHYAGPMGQKCARQECKAWAIKGGTVCSAHGGRSPRVKAKAAVRAELMNWNLNDTTEDPGAALLRLVTQASRRCQHYAAELERLVDAEGSRKHS